MKVLVMNSLCLDTFLLMKYLKAKKIPFWVYVYDADEERMEKVENYTDINLSDSEFSLLKKDFGQFIEYSSNIWEEFVYDYYFDKLDEIRADKDLIQAYEENPENLFDRYHIEEVPEGEEFAVIAIVDRYGGINERLILKSKTNWMKSK